MTSATRRALPALLLTTGVLAVAFAGGATAAGLITGEQIKNNSITNQDVKNSSLKGNDVKNGTIGEVDLNGKTRKKLNAPNTPPTSPLAGYEVKSTKVEVGSGGKDTVFVACTPGKLAVGGGGTWETTEFSAVIQESAPQKVIGDFFAPATPTHADAWRVTGEHNGLDPADLTAWVICVDPS